MGKYLSINDVAKRLCIGYHSARKLIICGEIQSLKIKLNKNTVHKVDEDVLNQWITANSN